MTDTKPEMLDQTLESQETPETPESTEVQEQSEIDRLREELERKDARIREMAKQRADERAKTIEVTRKYARQHNLCEVVDRALIEAELIGPGVPMRIKAQVEVGIDIEMDESFAQMSEEEQLAVVQGVQLTVNTGTVQVTGLEGRVQGLAYGNVRRNLPQVSNGRVQIVGVENRQAAVQEAVGQRNAARLNGVWVNGRYIAAYASSRGQARHLYMRADYLRMSRGERNDLGRRGVHALCHRGDTTTVFGASRQGYETICTRCNEIAISQGFAPPTSNDQVLAQRDPRFAIAG